MFKKLGLSLMLIGVMACSHSVYGQAVPAGQQRILQPIIINGQQAQGVMVVQNGSIQSFTCPAPQQYVTVDQSSSGWACFEQTTGMWLLHAQPPPPTTYAYQQPPVPNIPVYSYYSYGYYPYSYYPYFYPYIVGPRFGFGLGFGFRSPVIVNRTIIGRPLVPFAASRPFGGFRQVGRGFGRGGRR